MDYTTISLADVRADLEAVAREAESMFGTLTGPQVNWQPDAGRWSVGQCFEHLVTTNRLMREAAEAALLATEPRTIWQRLPVLPGLFGRLLIRSMSPGAPRKLTAPVLARPSSSAAAPDVVPRFVAQSREIQGWVRGLDESAAARAIMTSPFAGTVTYSVLDAARILAAHGRRHVQQAARVAATPGFPA